MAGRKIVYRLFAQSMEKETDGGFAFDEFDESDVWGCTIEPRSAAESIRNKPIPSSRSNRKKSGEKGDRVASAAASLPVNIPDWSKILKGEYRGNNSNGYNNKGRLLELDGDEEEEEDRLLLSPRRDRPDPQGTGPQPGQKCNFRKDRV